MEDSLMSGEQTITVYGTKWCPDCHRARRILDGRDIPYIYIDINRDQQACAYVEQVNHGNRSVPTILFPDGEILVEPSINTLNAKLDTLK
jgi:mycoredoxin